jgi:prophage DNA circulation protein
MIQLTGFGGQPALRDIEQLKARLTAAAMLARPADSRDAAEIDAAVARLTDTVAALPASRAAYAADLVAAWQALGVLGEATAVPGLIGEALADRIESDAGWLGRAVLAGALAVAVVRQDYAARQDARAARERFAAAVAPSIEGVGQALGDEAAAALSAVTGEAALALSRLAATLAPVVRVETNLSLSAVRAAHELYGDANRAGELVARNRVATPALMPAVFEALAP